MFVSNVGELVNLVELAHTVANNWGQNHPEYQVKFITYQELMDIANNFRAKTTENTQLDSQKQVNTFALRNVNREIDTAVKVFKKYIQSEYPNEKDLSSYYSVYGLEPSKRGFYTICVDNDRRCQRVAMLVSKLSMPGDIFAIRTFGLAYWQELAFRHQTEWNKSKNMKARKTTLSRETKELAVAVSDLLRKLQLQLKVDHTKEDFPRMLREFGFLKEVYR